MEHFTDLTMDEYVQFCNDVAGIDMTINTKEIEEDDMEAKCRFQRYIQGQKTWSSKERYAYAMSATRWAKRVRDKLDCVVEYWEQQRATYPDPDLLEHNLEAAYTAQSLQEEKWSPIVCFWIRQYNANDK